LIIGLWMKIQEQAKTMSSNSSSDKKAKKAKSSFSFCTWVVMPLLAFVPVYRTLSALDPITFIYPNFLLFTSQRNTTREYWEKNLKIDTSIIHEPTHLPVILAKDFSMKSLKKATEGFRYPAVVRGLFNNTPAMDKWASLEYLPSRIGKFQIPVIREAIVGKVQNNRVTLPFEEAFTEIITNVDSKMYLFFPVKSRFNFNGSDVGSLEALQNEINDIVREDLELDRIWKGFGTKAHSTFFGSQLIIGQGSEDSEKTTGTGWHCAAGNNWFVQVMGTKRWYFMDPKYSSQMHPLRGGKVNMMTGTRLMHEYQKHIPLRYADIRAGDLLYNPDWEWHTIQNYAGLSIGVPIREVNISLSLQNNLQYTGIILVNKVLEKFGLDIGGYPPSN